MKHGATLGDVAQRAGVSIVTVSTVLNGSRTNTRVSEATRRRVLAAADMLQYRPNAVARSLRARQTNIIGFYGGSSYVNARNPFLSELIGGLQEGCDAHRKDLLLHGNFHICSVEDICASLVSRTIDGLVVRTQQDDPLVERLAASGLPAVAVADAAPPLPSVVVDDADGSYQIAALLAARGHRRILYRGCSKPLRSARCRLDAFREAAAVHEMEVTVTYPEFPNTDAPAVNAIRLTPEEEALLTGPAGRRPTAAVCWADVAAYALLRECQRLGLRVPQDLAVVGFDALPPPIDPARRVTSVRAPWAAVARTAVALLTQRIAGEPIPVETVLPVELQEGDTI